MAVAAEALERLHSDAKMIFARALEECAIPNALDRHLHFQGNDLLLHPSPLVAPRTEPLGTFRRILVIAFGKAAAPMLDSLMDRLPPKLRDARVQGMCATGGIPARRHRHIRYFDAGHPLPTEDSLAAARYALELLRKAGRETFVFFLVSGGGSSMLELPADPSLSLDDLRAFHETLVSSGASITEINTVRKYFSSVKGGRLAAAARDARKLTLLVADVPLRDLALVASSPTLPDGSTWEGCTEVLERYGLLERFPSAVREYFARLALAPPTPLRSIENNNLETLASNHDLLNSARTHARALGYKTVIDDTTDDWPFSKASAYLLDRLRRLSEEYGRVCLLSGGELSVPVPPAESLQRGCGGRNQHFVLQAALDLERLGVSSPVVVFSGGSDGLDGNSPAAGALADPSTAARARELHFAPEQALATFNSCPLFTALGDVIVTGPTGNNLRDLRVLLAEAPGV